MRSIFLLLFYFLFCFFSLRLFCFSFCFFRLFFVLFFVLFCVLLFVLFCVLLLFSLHLLFSFVNLASSYDTILIPSEASHVTVVDGLSSSDLVTDELRRSNHLTTYRGQQHLKSMNRTALPPKWLRRHYTLVSGAHRPSAHGKRTPSAGKHSRTHKNTRRTEVSFSVEDSLAPFRPCSWSHSST